MTITTMSPMFTEAELKPEPSIDPDPASTSTSTARCLELYQGDCLDWLRDLPANSVDAWVIDPPASINFMG